MKFVCRNVLPMMLLALCGSVFAADSVVYDLAKNFSSQQIISRNAKISLVRRDNINYLRVDTLSEPAAREPQRVWPVSVGLWPIPKTDTMEHYPGVTLPLVNAPWDLSGYETLEMEVVNLDTYGGSIRLRVDSEFNGNTKMVAKSIWQLGAGQRATLRIPLAAIDDSGTRIALPLRGVLPPWMKQPGIDLARVIRFVITADNPDFSHSFLIGNLKATGQRANHDAPAGIFPLLDQFGQYAHQEWTGKVHSAEDLKNNREREKEDLAQNPPPADWDRFGGWAKGPKLEATGFFRLQEYKGKWWLVTPEGTLFFSRGPNTIDTWHFAQVSGRENWHTPMTDRRFLVTLYPGTPQAKQWYNYGAWNLYSKYGKDYTAIFMDLTHTRLHSWGLNTVANCSNVELCAWDKTPFFIKVQTRNSPKLEGYDFYKNYDFFDVFDPEYRKTLQAGMQEYAARFKDDPWCVGFYVDNELRWSLNEYEIPMVTLRSPKSAAKKVFISDLEKKYHTIDALNQSWGTAYSSWDSMLQSKDLKDLPEIAKAGPDLKAFFIKTAETYFSMVRDELKKVAPHHLYFGPRFADMGSNETVLRVAATYCDVLSFNSYTASAHDFLHYKHITDLQVPMIVGEFHFGALDRGLLDPGVGPCAQDQADRARMYKDYVYDLMADPRFVGCHYFQFRDQPLTGDVHNEACQIGFVDVADTPYGEMVAASREIGKTMYRYRMDAPKKLKPTGDPGTK